MSNLHLFATLASIQFVAKAVAGLDTSRDFEVGDEGERSDRKVCETSLRKVCID